MLFICRGCINQLQNGSHGFGRLAGFFIITPCNSDKLFQSLLWGQTACCCVKHVHGMCYRR